MATRKELIFDWAFAFEWSVATGTPSLGPFWEFDGLGMCGDFEQKQHGILFCLRHSFLTSRFYEGKTSEMLPFKHEDRALSSKGTSDYNFYVKT